MSQATSMTMAQFVKCVYRKEEPKPRRLGGYTFPESVPEDRMKLMKEVAKLAKTTGMSNTEIARRFKIRRHLVSDWLRLQIPVFGKATGWTVNDYHQRYERLYKVKPSLVPIMERVATLAEDYELSIYEISRQSGANYHSARRWLKGGASGFNNVTGWNEKKAKDRILKGEA